MTNLRAWISAARLRTLPLSISGILIGTALAWKEGISDATVTWLAILTTVCFQITSNFANDYGDGIKGTDNPDRLGPSRAVQSGRLSAGQMKAGIAIMLLLSIVCIVAVLYAAFGVEQLPYFMLFVFLGLASLWAAIKYTVGVDAYGYKGLGDIYVFIFFGLLGVLGSFFLYTQQLKVITLLPAIAIGCLCTGVLNLNNLRDHDNDERSGKRTLVVKMGFAKAKIYHYGLLGTALLSMGSYNLLEGNSGWLLLHMLAFIPIVLHARVVARTDRPEALDKELKKLALSTAFMALLLMIGYYYFL